MSQREFKVGDIVDYHSIIDEGITSREHQIVALDVAFYNPKMLDQPWPKDGESK